MENIDLDKDSFADILGKDKRYAPRAYALLMAAVQSFGGSDAHFSGEDVMEEFKEIALDEFGPLAYTVLTEWGVKRCEDIGEMMMNLAESGRVHKDDDDSTEAFACGYDFQEAFLGPFNA